MVWGEITLDDRIDLVIVPGRYSSDALFCIDNFLEDNLVPVAVGMDPNLVHMQDNARSHTANVTYNFLRDLQIEVMD